MAFGNQNSDNEELKAFAPPALKFESHVFDVAFHPQQDIIASALITGDVACYKLASNFSEQNQLLFSSKFHKKSCRALTFNYDGSALYTGSKDQSILAIDSTTGKLKLRKTDAHNDPINCLYNMDENLLASGDDGGCVKIWDLRQKKKVIEWKENQDFISDIKYVPHKKTAVVTSGDGCLSIFDIRKEKPVSVSDNQDDELLSVVIVKNTKKAVVGTQDGVLSLFSWGNWGDCTDRFPGHPSSIDAIVKIDEDTICTGSSDGLIRVIGILPNKLIGVIGDHDGMPIERMQLSSSKKWMGTCSHDSVVRFWDVAYLFEEEEDEDEKMKDNGVVFMDEKLAENGSDEAEEEDEEDEEDDSDSVSDSSEDEMSKSKTNPSSSSNKKSPRGVKGGIRKPLIINGKDVAKLAAAHHARERQIKEEKDLLKQQKQNNSITVQKKINVIKKQQKQNDSSDGDSDDLKKNKKSKKKSKLDHSTLKFSGNGGFFSGLD